MPTQPDGMNNDFCGNCRADIKRLENTFAAHCDAMSDAARQTNSTLTDIKGVLEKSSADMIAMLKDKDLFAQKLTLLAVKVIAVIAMVGGGAAVFAKISGVI